jgi:hypothetical protein
LKIDPESLNFGAVKVGSHKGPRNVTVSNPKGNKKNPGITVLMDGVSGAGNPFIVTNGCSAPLPPGRNCNIAVVFAPTAGGPSNATLMIIDNAKNGTQSVRLRGKGKAK